MGLFKKKDTEKDLLAHQAEQDASVGTAADVEAVMKKYDRESNTRSWEGTPKPTPSWIRCFSRCCPSGGCPSLWA